MDDVKNLDLELQECRKKTEVFKQRVDELTDFIENASLPLHWVDHEGIIIWANQVELDSLGYKKEEYIGYPISRFHADEHVISDILTRLTNNETLINYPATLKCKDGSIRHVLINSNVYRIDGKFIHTRCFTRDITDFRLQEQSKADLLKELEAKNETIKKYAEGLANERQTLNNFFMQAPVAFCLFKTPDHVYEFANPDYFKLVGRVDIIGKPLREVFPELAGQGFIELMDNVYKTGKPFIGKEMPLYLKEGTFAQTGYVDFIYQAYKNTEGEIEGIMVFGHDVTEKVLARQKIQESADRMLTVLESLPQMAWTALPTGEVNYFSQSWCDFTGQTQEQALGSGWENTLHPDNLEPTLEAWKKSIEQGTPYEVENMAKGADGVYQWMWVKAIPLKNKHGEIYLWAGTITDIHAQKSFAEELEKKVNERTEDLNIKNSQLSGAQSIAKLGYWEWDLATNKVTWSKGLFDIYEITPTPDGLMYENFLEYVHPDDKNNVDQTIKQAFTDKKFTTYYHRIVTPAGNIKILQAKGEVMTDSKGNIIKMNGTGQDVSEQKKAEQELLIKTKELQSSNSELQKFAYVASHDLQEPLRKIKTFVSRLQTEIPAVADDPKGRKYMGKVVDAASRMQTLMTDILDYSKLSSNTIGFEQTDLNKIVSQVLTDMEVMIENSGASIKVHKLSVIEANNTQMVQLFQNLITNAIKFKQSNAQPVIDISAEHLTGKLLNNTQLKEHYKFADWNESKYWEKEKFCRIKVRDNGIGIDDAYSQRIFIAFEKLHNSKEYEGSGIGLAICKKIVDYHHGIISVNSVTGQGSEFIITLPISQTDFVTNLVRV